VTPTSTSALLLRAGGRSFALSIEQVLEIMRPLPVEALAHAPAFVRGLSIIRGAPTPVVSLATLFTGHDGQPTRFVVVRVGERRVALAVDAVLGVFKLDPATVHALPPLAQTADAETLQAVGALDAHLLFVLNSTYLVPDGVWQELAGHD
jgi:purine-binding chemotaxis protein CheW